MAPIKVGLIGLTSPVTGSPNEGTKWAVLAHLNYLKNNGGKYEIVALLNSSKERAESARGEYQLGDVKCYGSPDEFANDTNIDFVVCSVRVDKHFSTTKPSILAKKNVYIEWPLGSNLTQAQELLTLSQEQNVQTVLGLQASFSPVIEKVKELIDQSKIGRVLSSTFIGHSEFGGSMYPEGLSSFLDKDIGASMLTIPFPHTIEYVLYVLGDFKTWNSMLANQHPTVNIVTKDGKTVLQKDQTKSTPDQIMIQGLTGSGAILSYHLREMLPFPNTPILDWRIFGEKGELRITSSSIYLNTGAMDTTISFVEHGNTEVEAVEIRKDEWESLIPPGRNIARLYEAFADKKKGGIGKTGYRDFEYAVERHKLIDAMQKKWDEQSGR